MAMSARLLVTALALNLFALTLSDPSASSRPVRAEIATDTKLPRIGAT